MDNGLLLLLGLGAYLLYSKANTASSLQFLPLGANWNGGTLQIQVGVQNPTNGTLTLSSLAATAYVNGTPTGNVSDFTPAIIAPNAQTPIQLNFNPNVIGIAQDLLSELNTQSAMNISLKGTANVNGVSLPVNINFTAAV